MRYPPISYQSPPLACRIFSCTSELNLSGGFLKIVNKKDLFMISKLEIFLMFLSKSASILYSFSSVCEIDKRVEYTIFIIGSINCSPVIIFLMFEFFKISKYFDFALIRKRFLI